MRRNSDGAWNRAASTVGALVIYPQGKPQGAREERRSWNDCRNDLAKRDPANSNWNDVAFITTGSADELMPATGGRIANNCDKGTVRATDATVEFWRKRLGATLKQETKSFPDTDQDDHSVVERITYSGALPHQILVHDLVIGGGHSVPGGPQWSRFVRERLGTGWRNRDINTPEEAVKFFLAFKLSDRNGAQGDTSQ